MKYPKPQFELLVKGLNVLKSLYNEDIKTVHPCQLQYILHQQATEGQAHNWIYVNKDGRLNKGYYIAAFDMKGYVKVIDFLTEENFPLYPDGCTDSHVETAVKAALKLIK